MSSEPGTSKGGSAKGSGGRTASATPGRDETSVDVGSDETRMDLDKVEEDAARPEIAPADDADEPPGTGDRDPAPLDSPAGKPSSTTSGGWATPSEASTSSSRDRAGKSSRPFGRREASGSGKKGGFAGTVLKDRPAPSGTAPVKTSTQPAVAGKPARKAQLQLARLEPWSVMKFSFVMSLVCFVVLLVAVVVLYAILSGLGVFDAISDTINSLTKQQGETTGGVDAGSWFSFFRIFGYTVLVGALNVLLITALSTVGSVIYNLAADLVGGVEVTLKEAE
ncbi:DUF3566 domain-containing protein [Actinomadura roseirufa]|uniref:DUF3566 domain-containing protein n=1 Tax=Actinomadura roseirufa TaxID=2094049 RepID=UPI001F5ECB3D|nr:DUF3566 domain-containing protein [Actinomadura roseirufa]